MKKQRITLLCFVSTLFFSMFTYTSFAQEKFPVAQSASPTSSKQPQRLEGLLRKIVAHSEDYESTYEFFVLERNRSMMRIQVPASQWQDFDNSYNQKISILGVVEGKKINPISMKLLSKPKLAKQPNYESLPMGLSEYDLSSQNLSRVSSVPEFLVVAPPLSEVVKNYNVMGEFSNNQNWIYSREQLDQLSFSTDPAHTSLYHYFQQASNGRMTYIGETQAPSRGPFTDANCEENMFSTWFDYWMSTVPLAKFQENNYFTIFMPRAVGCPYGAMATVGYKNGDGDIKNYSWIPLSVAYQSIAHFVTLNAHENGHKYGYAHSCGYHPVTGVCNDYQDKADIMGTAEPRFPNGYNSISLGWFNGKIVALNGSQFQVINIFPWVDFRKKKPMSVIIPIKNADGSFTGEMFLLEVRRNYSWYETFASPMNLHHLGVGIRRGPMDLSAISSRPGLYDYSQGSVCCFHAPYLQPGQQMSVTEAGTTITVLYNAYALVNGARLSITVSGP